MIRVLFICNHNSVRSQMAEAFLNKLGNGFFYAESAGLVPTEVHPATIMVMKEIGYDISKQTTNSVFGYYREGKEYEIVVKMCDKKEGDSCPVFNKTEKELYWSLDDPAKIEGTDEEKLNKLRKIRNELKIKVELLVEEYIELL